MYKLDKKGGLKITQKVKSIKAIH